MHKNIEYYDKKIKKAHKALKAAYKGKLEFCKFFEHQGHDIINEDDAVQRFDLRPSEVKHLRSECEFFEDRGEKFYNVLYLLESVRRYRDRLNDEIENNKDEDEDEDEEDNDELE